MVHPARYISNTASIVDITNENTRPADIQVLTYLMTRFKGMACCFFCSRSLCAREDQRWKTYHIKTDKIN